MEARNASLPIFYDVDPSNVRNQQQQQQQQSLFPLSGVGYQCSKPNGDYFEFYNKHERNFREDLAKCNTGELLYQKWVISLGGLQRIGKHHQGAASSKM
ncbi:hypothetical protein ACFX1X_002542 [Malus domestica]|uniref:TIR domain-containing protein n=1 Tax=Malus domestica TaxID=3750 RepID=A0A498ITY8_MALDO|nr:hypothetical protein DVH24_009408 [Malus domestica]